MNSIGFSFVCKAEVKTQLMIRCYYGYSSLKHTVFVLYLCHFLLSIHNSNFLYYAVCLRLSAVLYCENVLMPLIANCFSFVPAQPFFVRSMLSCLSLGCVEMETFILKVSCRHVADTGPSTVFFPLFL